LEWDGGQAGGEIWVYLLIKFIVDSDPTLQIWSGQAGGEIWVYLLSSLSTAIPPYKSGV